MSSSEETRDKLLHAARNAFWERGYGNVPLRSIAKTAGVDVALVSRYFGGKHGLFEATLENVFAWPELTSDNELDLIGVVVRKYSNPNNDDHGKSVMQMILMNAADPDVGDLVRAQLETNLLAPLRTKMGGLAAAPNVALFTAVLLGASMARQCLKLPGIADVSAEIYAAELRHMIEAAMSFKA